MTAAGGWDPAQHPRIPGGHGGGEFRSLRTVMADLVSGLQAHEERHGTVHVDARAAVREAETARQHVAAGNLDRAREALGRAYQHASSGPAYLRPSEQTRLHFEEARAHLSKPQIGKAGTNGQPVTHPLHGDLGMVRKVEHTTQIRARRGNTTIGSTKRTAYHVAGPGERPSTLSEPFRTRAEAVNSLHVAAIRRHGDQTPVVHTPLHFEVPQSEIKASSARHKDVGTDVTFRQPGGTHRTGRVVGVDGQHRIIESQAIGGVGTERHRVHASQIEVGHPSAEDKRRVAATGIQLQPVSAGQARGAGAHVVVRDERGRSAILNPDVVERLQAEGHQITGIDAAGRAVVQRSDGSKISLMRDGEDAAVRDARVRAGTTDLLSRMQPQPSAGLTQRSYREGPGTLPIGPIRDLHGEISKTLASAPRNRPGEAVPEGHQFQPGSQPGSPHQVLHSDHGPNILHDNLRHAERSASGRDQLLRDTAQHLHGMAAKPGVDAATAARLREHAAAAERLAGLPTLPSDRLQAVAEAERTGRVGEARLEDLAARRRDDELRHIAQSMPNTPEGRAAASELMRRQIEQNRNGAPSSRSAKQARVLRAAAEGDHAYLRSKGLSAPDGSKLYVSEHHGSIHVTQPMDHEGNVRTSHYLINGNGNAVSWAGVDLPADARLVHDPAAAGTHHEIPAPGTISGLSAKQRRTMQAADQGDHEYLRKQGLYLPEGTQIHVGTHPATGEPMIALHSPNAAAAGGRTIHSYKVNGNGVPKIHGVDMKESRPVGTVGPSGGPREFPASELTPAIPDSPFAARILDRRRMGEVADTRDASAAGGKLTAADVEDAIHDPRHGGFGLATMRNLRSGAQQRLRGEVANKANELGLTKEDLFNWANSVHGRRLVDEMSYPGTPSKKDTRLAVDRHLNQSNIDRLRTELAPEPTTRPYDPTKPVDPLGTKLPNLPADHAALAQRLHEQYSTPGPNYDRAIHDNLMRYRLLKNDGRRDEEAAHWLEQADRLAHNKQAAREVGVPSAPGLAAPSAPAEQPLHENPATNRALRALLGHDTIGDRTEPIVRTQFPDGGEHVDPTVTVDAPGATEHQFRKGRDGVWRHAFENTYGNTQFVRGPGTDASGARVTNSAHVQALEDHLRQARTTIAADPGRLRNSTMRTRTITSRATGERLAAEGQRAGQISPALQHAEDRKQIADWIREMGGARHEERLAAKLESGKTLTNKENTDLISYLNEQIAFLRDSGRPEDQAQAAAFEAMLPRLQRRPR